MPHCSREAVCIFKTNSGQNGYETSVYCSSTAIYTATEPTAKSIMNQHFWELESRHGHSVLSHITMNTIPCTTHLPIWSSWI